MDSVLSKSYDQILSDSDALKDKIFVIKIGGAVMEDCQKKESFIKDLALLNHIGIKFVLVHGGGKQISKYLNQMSIESEFVGGYRVTSKTAVDVVEMVLSGHINKDLAHALKAQGIKSVGISGKDNGLILAHKKVMYKNNNEINLGYVGEIEAVDISIIELLLEKGYLPVISPVAADELGNTLNINADDVAAGICKALHAEKLFLMTDVKGLYKEFGNESSFISKTSVKEISEIIARGSIQSGMIPKLKSCISSLEAGSQSVHILNGLIEHNLLLEILDNQGVGTLITREVS